MLCLLIFVLIILSVIVSVLTMACFKISGDISRIKEEMHKRDNKR